MSLTKPQIPEWLANASFEDLFLRAESPRPVDQPDALASLAAVAASPGVSPKLRALAHELLIEAGHAPDPSLTETYCQTLPDTFSHNAWGMPGRHTACHYPKLFSYALEAQRRLAGGGAQRNHRKARRYCPRAPAGAPEES